MICSVEGCGSSVAARGMCRPHYAKQWRIDNAERKRATQAAWRAANQDKIQASRDVYRQSGAKAKADRRWRQANRESETARRMAWDQAHPERVKERMRDVRAKRRGAFVEKVDIDLIWERDGGSCGLCGIAIDRSLSWPHPQSLSLDHVIPLSKGGTHEPDNAQCAHLHCNTLKGNRIP